MTTQTLTKEATMTATFAAPAPTLYEETAGCCHSLNDITGYVVAISHKENGDVRFEDREYINNPSGFTHAVTVKNQLIAQIRAKEIPGTYAVIHNVYACGHRFI